MAYLLFLEKIAIFFQKPPQKEPKVLHGGRSKTFFEKTRKLLIYIFLYPIIFVVGGMCMRKNKDSLAKEYIKDNAIFADLINYYFFDGKKKVNDSDLKELDTT